MKQGKVRPQVQTQQYPMVMKYIIPHQIHSECLTLSTSSASTTLYIPSLPSYTYPLQWFLSLLLLWMLLKSLFFAYTFIPFSWLQQTLPCFFPHLHSSFENLRPSSIALHTQTKVIFNSVPDHYPNAASISWYSNLLPNL